MLAELMEQPQTIVVIGDVFVSSETMRQAVEASHIPIKNIHEVFWGEHTVESFSIKQVNIEKNGPDAEPYPEELDSLIEDADIIMMHFAPIPGSLIRKAKHLKAILTCRGGVEQVDVTTATACHIPVINVIRNAEPVADFTLGLILAMTRNIATSHHLMMQGIWSKQYPNYEYTTNADQLTVGIAGLGNVGIALAKRLQALHIPMLGFDEYVSLQRLKENGLEIKMVSTLQDLFTQADVISMHLRLTEETRGMIDASYFACMKPGGYFINTSRGGLVKQKDLIQVLKEHRIAGAALDVFEAEPVTLKDGFSELDNIIITPHIAGDTVSAVPKSPFLLMKEVDLLLQGGSMERIVNRKDLY